MEKVLKPFATRNRRFSVGMDVIAADIDGDVSFGTWQDRGFISGGASQSVEPASPMMKDAPAPKNRAK